mmetsp:Transcript_50323/g.104783  ORF Transcript_50323/g.104783 Transcript_50323/m.104783 type:complete len:97 (-) Transcript_50323:99-389(-)
MQRSRRWMELMFSLSATILAWTSPTARNLAVPPVAPPAVQRAVALLLGVLLAALLPAALLPAAVPLAAVLLVAGPAEADACAERAARLCLASASFS